MFKNHYVKEYIMKLPIKQGIEKNENVLGKDERDNLEGMISQLKVLDARIKDGFASIQELLKDFPIDNEGM